MKRYTLRLPNELHAALAQMAKDARRSLHAQMLWILERAVEEHKMRNGNAIHDDNLPG
jgi:hypothetical protein